jgi:hypothetical protein
MEEMTVSDTVSGSATWGTGFVSLAELRDMPSFFAPVRRRLVPVVIGMWSKPARSLRPLLGVT